MLSKTEAFKYIHTVGIGQLYVCCRLKREGDSLTLIITSSNNISNNNCTSQSAFQFQASVQESEIFLSEHQDQQDVQARNFLMKLFHNVHFCDREKGRLLTAQNYQFILKVRLLSNIHQQKQRTQQPLTEYLCWAIYQKYLMYLAISHQLFHEY